MSEEIKRDQSLDNDSTNPSTQSDSKQEKSDPQITELRGFTDPSEDIEPTLTDGSKSPDKAQEEYKRDQHKRDHHNR